MKSPAALTKKKKAMTDLLVFLFLCLEGVMKSYQQKMYEAGRDFLTLAKDNRIHLPKIINEIPK